MSASIFAFHLRLLLVDLAQRVMQFLLVFLHLGADILPRLTYKMPMMLPFDTPFQTERDEETHRNGGQVDEDVTPAMRRLLWRVDVDHWLFVRGMRIVPLLAHIASAPRA